jgi:hypothetical protein
MLAISLGILKQINAQIVQVLTTESEVLARVQDGFHTMIKARAADGREIIKRLPASMRSCHCLE